MCGSELLLAGRRYIYIGPMRTYGVFKKILLRKVQKKIAIKDVSLDLSRGRD
jgi:hypothetical protein